VNTFEDREEPHNEAEQKEIKESVCPSLKEKDWRIKLVIGDLPN